MPITRSAKKAWRQSLKKKDRNVRRKKAFKEIVLKISKLKKEGKKDEAVKLLPSLYKAIDKAARTGVIKKNTADRKKSRLTISLNK